MDKYFPIYYHEKISSYHLLPGRGGKNVKVPICKSTLVNTIYRHCTEQRYKKYILLLKASQIL